MTTETRFSPAPKRNWLLAVGVVAAVVSGWIVVVMALTFMAPVGRAMAIVGPPSRALAAIVAADGQVLASRGYVTFARSDQANFVAALYAAGALLVLDAEQVGGCSGAPRAITAASL